MGYPPGLAAAIGEIERVLGTPLAQLIDSEHGHAHELPRQASAAAAILRFGELVAFVGRADGA